MLVSVEMGLKSDTHPSNHRTANSFRGGKVRQDSLVKQVIETTRCTHTEAEEALLECNNDLDSAVNFIIDRNGDNVWTEQKNRKAKKAEQEEPTRATTNGTNGFRGGKRGGRGGVRREGGQQREFRPRPRDTTTENNTDDRRIVRTNGRGRFNKSVDIPKTDENTSDKQPEASEDVVGKENKSTRPSYAAVGDRRNYRNGRGSYSKVREGQRDGYRTDDRQYKHSDETSAVATPAPVQVKEIQNKAGPLSYAALVARGNQKEVPVASQPAPTQSSVQEIPPQIDTPKAGASTSEETQASSTAETKDLEATTETLTSQLKNDLGLSSIKANEKGVITVEHNDGEPTDVDGYRFGPASSQANAQPQQKSQMSQSVNPDEQNFVSANNVSVPVNDFTRTHESELYKSPEPVMPKGSPVVPSPQMHTMAAYGVQTNQQLLQNNIPRRNLGYAETNSVTIQPEKPTPVAREAPVTTVPSYQNYNKPPVTAAPSVAHQQLGVHHQQNQQQQMYNPMYGNFPYVNLYSPVAGREDQTPYANPYMPYQFGMDMSSLPHVIPHLPMQHQIGQHHQTQGGMNHQGQGGLSHQPQSGHRNDHLPTGYSEKMQSYGQSNATSNNSVGQNGQRENSNIPPPPGFSGPPGNMGNPFPWRRFL